MPAPSLVTLATFQMCSRHMWVVATILYSSDTECVHHHRKFYWTSLLQQLSNVEIRGKRTSYGGLQALSKPALPPSPILPWATLYLFLKEVSLSPLGN